MKLMRKFNLISRDKFISIIKNAKEVEGIHKEFTYKNAYLYKDTVYIFSKDRQYYYKISYENYKFLTQMKYMNHKLITVI